MNRTPFVLVQYTRGNLMVYIAYEVCAETRFLSSDEYERQVVLLNIYKAQSTLAIQ